MPYLMTKTNRYRLENLSNELILDRVNLQKYWQLPFNTFKKSGIITRHALGMYWSGGYSQNLVTIYRCEISGKLLRCDGTPQTKNVYGYHVHTTRDILVQNGYVWINNLETYMHESDLYYLQYCDAKNSNSTNTKIIVDDRLFDADLWSEYKWSDYHNMYLHDVICMFDANISDYLTISEYNSRYSNEYCHRCDEDMDYCCCDNEYPQLSCYEKCALDQYGFIDTRNKDLFFSRRYQSRPLAKQTRYYGLEIELHLDTASSVTELRNRLESNSLALGCKDGSLSEQVGIEIKTPPIQNGVTLQKYLKAIYAYVKDYDVDVSNNMGLHVNISRSSVSNITIGKLQTFIHNPHNFQFMEYIARRHSEQWACFNTTKNLKSDFNKRRGYLSDQKYTALNIKRDVLEFRLFKTCENYEQAITSCELCDSLISFVQTIPLKDVHRHNIKFEDYIRFLEKRKNWWSNAYDYVFKKYIHVQYELEQVLIHSVN